MNKFAVLILLLSTSLSPPAQADSIPGELLGTWTVWKTGTGYDLMKESTNTTKTVWILKGEGDDNHFVIEAYGITPSEQVVRWDFPLQSVRYSDEKMTILTMKSNFGVFDNHLDYEITFKTGGKSPTGDGSYSEWQESQMGNSLLNSIGGMGTNTRQQTGNGLIGMRKTSNSTVPPKSKPLPPSPPPATYSVPMFVPAPMNFGGGMPFVMPAPMNFGGGSSPDFGPSAARGPSCSMQQTTCLRGCEAPTFGITENMNRNIACRQQCYSANQGCRN